LLFVTIVGLVFTFAPEYFSSLVDRGDGLSTQNIPQLIFWPLCLLVTVLAHAKDWSLIPVLGLLSCCYLLTGMAVSNWVWFSIWLVIGLLCYFAYGYRNSRLATP
jgi:hypothetical protein